MVEGVYGYGAPTKASLVLKLLKSNIKNIEFFVEDNELKHNKYLSQNGIKILPNFPENLNRKI